jgi:hypothetical protein
VPPAPVTVVTKQQYLLLHLQSPELSVVLPVSFLQLPFVIVYPQPTVSGTEVVPDISIPRTSEYQREEEKKWKGREAGEGAIQRFGGRTIRKDDIPELSTSPWSRK